MLVYCDVVTPDANATLMISMAGECAADIRQQCQRGLFIPEFSHGSVSQAPMQPSPGVARPTEYLGTQIPMIYLWMCLA